MQTILSICEKLIAVMNLKAVFPLVLYCSQDSSSGFMRQALFILSKIFVNKIQTSVCTGKQKALDL